MEYAFAGKSKAFDGQLVVGSLVKVEDRAWIISKDGQIAYEIFPESARIWTGFVDRKGNYIYDKNVISFTSVGKKDMTIVHEGVVVFKNGSWFIDCSDNHGNWFVDCVENENGIYLLASIDKVDGIIHGLNCLVTSWGLD